MVAARSKSYRYRITFDAPLPFVYRWCTDFDPGDARLEGEEYERKILVRNRRQVVFEDLSESKDGWTWKRQRVELLPPDRWTCRSIGNYRISDLDYRLRERPGGRTELDIRSKRTPTGVGGPNPSAASYQRMMDDAWVRFRRNLERDHRRGRAG